MSEYIDLIKKCKSKTTFSVKNFSFLEIPTQEAIHFTHIYQFSATLSEFRKPPGY